MFGKHFAQMYQGSMVGRPAIFFAVWGYIIAHQRPINRLSKCTVEVNPILLAFTFSTTPAEILSVLSEMCSPDPLSRSKEADGRKLVPEFEGEIKPGPMTFRVVNGWKYRAMRDDEERRSYLAEKQAEHRAKKLSSTVSTNVNTCQPPSTQAEAEAEAEAEAKLRESKPQAAFAESPSLEEVLIFSDKIGLAKWKAEDWFNEMETCGWLDHQHRHVLKWKPLLTRVKVKWEADGRPIGPPTSKYSASPNPIHKQPVENVI